MGEWPQWPPKSCLYTKRLPLVQPSPVQSSPVQSNPIQSNPIQSNPIVFSTSKVQVVNRSTFGTPWIAWAATNLTKHSHGWSVDKENFKIGPLEAKICSGAVRVLRIITLLVVYRFSKFQVPQFTMYQLSTFQVPQFTIDFVQGLRVLSSLSWQF